MPTEDTLRNRAYHEAGHAVVNEALGREVVCLSIDTERIGHGVSGGRCVVNDLQPPTEDLDGEELQRRRFDTITIGVAGPLAQCSACGGEIDRLGASADLKAARELTYSLTADDPQQGFPLLDCAIRRADGILKQHAQALNALAAALLERTELTGDEVREIMASHKG